MTESVKELVRMTYGMARRCSRGVRIWVAAMTLLG